MFHSVRVPPSGCGKILDFDFRGSRYPLVELLRCGPDCVHKVLLWPRKCGDVQSPRALAVLGGSGKPLKSLTKFPYKHAPESFVTFTNSYPTCSWRPGTPRPDPKRGLKRPKPHWCHSRASRQLTNDSFYSSKGIPTLHIQARIVGLSSHHHIHRIGNMASPLFDSIEDSITAFTAGNFIVVLDSADRENEGDLLIAAEDLTTEKMAFMVRWTRCAPAPPQCHRQQLTVSLPAA